MVKPGQKQERLYPMSDFEVHTDEGIRISLRDDGKLYFRAEAEKGAPEEEVQLQKIAKLRDDLTNLGIGHNVYERKNPDRTETHPDCVILDLRNMRARSLG
jgi:hypothetical protein